VLILFIHRFFFDIIANHWQSGFFHQKDNNNNE
jgi:hypothetical protein